MQIVSVQTGRARDIPSGRGSIHSGIDKRPVGEITVEADGVMGDAIVSSKHHGGPGQAVYLYTREDYAEFEAALGTALPPGSFGENVTVDAWPGGPVRIGDRLRTGAVELEVTAPRIPCATFAARMRELVGQDVARGWVKRFTAERRPGWYCRVLAAGVLRAGDLIELDPAPAGNLTGLEMWDMYYDGIDEDQRGRALASPIADRARQAWSLTTP